MQKRYCLCGKTIWVEYVLFKDWITIFHPERSGSASIHRCPHCGLELDIDRLG
jgi:hypothetical protein